MSFRVQDLMISVGPLMDEPPSTCTLVTRTTGAGCVDSIFDHAQRRKHGLALLKAQLRQVVARA